MRVLFCLLGALDRRLFLDEVEGCRDAAECEELLEEWRMGVYCAVVVRPEFLYVWFAKGDNVDEVRDDEDETEVNE